MPSPPRRRASRREQYTDSHIDVLLTGCDFFRTFRSDDERRRAWHELRDELLPEWISEHPGTRPAAWWQFDAPEPRRKIRCEPILCADGADTGFVETEDETESAYLGRLKLLTAAEQKTLNAGGPHEAS